MADAYAAGVEFIERYPDIVDQKIKLALAFAGYIQHPLHKDLPPGCYTDDAEMSVANTHVLIECEPPYTKIMFANAYVQEFIRGGMRKGYAGGFYQFLSSQKNGQEFLDQIKPYSDKNGAAMRAVPFGVLPTIQDVLEVSSMQASLTHDTHPGLFSARAIALMSHFALYENEDFSKLKDYCLDNLPPYDISKFGSIFQKPWDGGPVTKRRQYPISITNVHAVFDLLTIKDSLMDIMRQLITWQGDTDSVAAIAWGIFSARHQNESLPDFMLSDLENGSKETGEHYLLSIGEKLMSKFI